jgi:hypothetical protein
METVEVVVAVETGVTTPSSTWLKALKGITH